MIWIILAFVIFIVFIVYSFLNKKTKKDLIKLQGGYNANENKSRREGTYRRGEPVEQGRDNTNLPTESSDAGNDELKGSELLQATADVGVEKNDGSDRELDNKLQRLFKRMKLKK